MPKPLFLYIYGNCGSTGVEVVLCSSSYFSLRAFRSDGNPISDLEIQGLMPAGVIPFDPMNG